MPEIPPDTARARPGYRHHEEFFGVRAAPCCLWANLQLTHFVYSLPDPEPQPRELLAHILYAELVWFERAEGSSRITNTFLHLSREELVRGFRENDATYRRPRPGG